MAGRPQDDTLIPSHPPLTLHKPIQPDTPNQSNNILDANPSPPQSDLPSIPTQSPTTNQNFSTPNSSPPTLSSLPSNSPMRKARARPASQMLQSPHLPSTTTSDSEPSPKRRNVESTDTPPVPPPVVSSTEKPSIPLPISVPPPPPPKQPHPNPPQLTSSAPPPLTMSFPLLRSSPVFRSDTNTPPNSTTPSLTPSPTSSDSKQDKSDRPVADPPLKPQDASTSQPSPQRRRERRVTWAPQEKLLDIHVIDSRAELVRVWDPDSRITLPFAPSTLQTLISDDQNQENLSTDSTSTHLPPVTTSDDTPHRNAVHTSSFEAALKREFDMELERTRRAREEIRNRLNAMSPTCRWSRPIAIVLPTECRIDPDTVEPFSLTDLDSLSKMAPKPYTNGHTDSPRSPPPERTALGQFRNGDVHVPNIPISDNGNDVQSLTEIGIDGGSSKGKYLHRESFDQNEKNKASMYGRNHDRHGKPTGNELRSARSSAMDAGNPNRRGGGIDDLSMGNGNSQKPPMRQGKLGLRPGGGGKGLEEKGPIPLPPQAVHHLLSALQSSGLLRPGGNGSLPDAQNVGNDHRMMEKEMVQNTFPGLLAHRESSPMIGDTEGTGTHAESERREGEHLANHNLANSVPPASSADPALGALPLMGHGQQMPLNFGGGNQQSGMMDCMPFPMPPMPPPPLGMPNLMPLGLGVPMPMGLPMGLALNMGHPPLPMNQTPGAAGMSAPVSSGRNVETISRPKTKPSKQRKRCKYFGTKQGCRDGSSCMFAHN